MAPQCPRTAAPLRRWRIPPSSSFFLKLIIIYLIYFWLCWGLRCCTRNFSSCGERGLFFIALQRLLIVVASLVAEHEFLGAWAQQFWPTGLIALWHV